MDIFLSIVLFVVLFLVCILPLSLRKFEKVGVAMRYVYGYVSFVYLAIMIGTASAPQHSFAAHLSDLTIHEALLVGYALVGLAVGLFEMFLRKSSKEVTDTTDNASEYPPHVG